MSLEVAGGVAAIGFAVGIATAVPATMWWYSGTVEENATLRVQIEQANQLQAQLATDNQERVDQINKQKALDIKEAIANVKDTVTPSIVYRDRVKPAQCLRPVPNEAVHRNDQAKTDPSSSATARAVTGPGAAPEIGSYTGPRVLIASDTFDAWKAVITRNLKAGARCIVIQRESARVLKSMQGLYIEAVKSQQE